MTNTNNRLSSIIFLLVITLLFGINNCAAHVRGSSGVRPLVKNGGAVNPHLSNIEKLEILRLKNQMEKGHARNARQVRGVEKARKRRVY